MSPDAVDLDLVWAVLETHEGDIAGLRVRGTGVHTPSGEILAASGADGRRHLLLPLPERAAFAPDTSTRGVHVTKHRLDTGQAQADFVDVECRMTHLNPVFVALSNDILNAVTDAPGQPATACRMVLDRWREFLGAERSPLLSEERLVGLLAELLVLRDILVHDDRLRLEVWTGPSGAVHDLRRGAHAIEVKATRVREGKFIEIHGVEQLEPPRNGALHLAWLRFESDESSPLSVPALVREFQGMGVDMLDMSERMALAGYDVTAAQDYELRRYRLVESRLYAVDALMPRIVPGSFSGASVPPGVLKVRYTVDLTNEPPVPLTPGARAEILRLLGTA